MKKTKIYEKVFKYKGKELYLSAVCIQFSENVSPEYRVGLFELPNMVELYENDEGTLTECEEQIQRLLKKYSEQKITSKNIPKRYTKLAKDINKVYGLCEQEFKNKDLYDGGASNFDCAMVYIGGRVKDAYLKEALKPYRNKRSIYCSVLHEKGPNNNCILIAGPYTQYQGNGNTEQALYLCECLKDLGYESSVYYRLD